jgi:hypothetical protein
MGTVAFIFTFSGEIMDGACAKGGGHESMFKKMGTNDPKVCTEACIKDGSKYVLFKPDKTFYQLDEQKKPAVSITRDTQPDCSCPGH